MGAVEAVAMFDTNIILAIIIFSLDIVVMRCSHNKGKKQFGNRQNISP